MIRDLLIGTYTESLPHVDGRGGGVLGAGFDGHAVHEPALAAAAINPSWVTATSDGSRVYAASETVPDGAVAAFARDASGGLAPLGLCSSGGAAPAHLTLDPSERFLIVGNYGGGSISVFALTESGALGERAAFVQHEGSGSSLDRQAEPHVHQLSFDPVTGNLVVVDLGLGAVLFYAFGSDGSLVELPEERVIIGAAGPRHLAFHPDGEYAFLANELDSTLTLLRRSGRGFEVVSSASTRPMDASGPNHPAAVRTSDDGRTVFVTNRGDDTVAVFAFEAADDGVAAELTLVTSVATQGATPRDLVVAPGGDRVLVANQDGGSVAVFSFDAQSRRLVFLSLTAAPTPVCLRFATSR